MSISTSARHAEPVTTSIIRGRFKGRKFPRTERFAANCRALARAYSGEIPRERHLPVVELFHAVELRSEILDTLSPTYDKVVAVLLRIASRSAQWVRGIDAWTPKAKWGEDQLSELVRHLFERYPTPKFFEFAWRRQRHTRVDWAAFDWYIHVAGGGNIRTAPGVPLCLTRRAAHVFASAPDDIHPRQALRWAQIRAAGVSRRLTRELLSTAAGSDFEHDSVWLVFFEKLGCEPAIRLEQVGPLVDYLRHRIGEAADAPFSLKGRSIASLLEGMQRWHLDLTTRRYAERFAGAAGSAARWSGLQDVRPWSETREGERWEISELASFEELYEEGRILHHCVATYTQACQHGWASIWSLRVERAGREVSRVTVRVNRTRRAVVEARTFCNGAITHEAFRFLETWARENGLGIERIPVLSAP